MEEWEKLTSDSEEKIAFISCSKTKNRGPCKTEFLYQGPLFKKALEYCRIHFRHIYILSAKYEGGDENGR